MQPGEIIRRFSTHRVNEEQQGRISELRQIFLDAARDAAALLPEGREESLVMTHLEEASFYAVAAVSRENA